MKSSSDSGYVSLLVTNMMDDGFPQSTKGSLDDGQDEGPIGWCDALFEDEDAIDLVAELNCPIATYVESRDPYDTHEDAPLEKPPPVSEDSPLQRRPSFPRKLVSALRRKLRRTKIHQKQPQKEAPKTTTPPPPRKLLKVSSTAPPLRINIDELQRSRAHEPPPRQDSAPLAVAVPPPISPTYDQMMRANSPRTALSMWLNERNLSEYEAILTEMGVRKLRDLVYLTDEDLTNMKVDPSKRAFFQVQVIA